MSVLANPQYALLWGSHTLAFGANSMASLLFPVIVVADHANHAAAPAIIAFAFGLPWLLLGIPAGVWADRMQPRQLVFWAGLTRAAGLGVAALAIGQSLGRADVILTLLAACIGGTMVVQAVATQATIPDVIEPGERQAANTWQFRATSAIELLSYLIGGSLSSEGSSTLALAGASFASLCGACLAVFLERTPRRENAQPDVLGGFKALLGHPATRQATVVTTVWRVSAGLGAALSVPYLIESRGVESALLGLAMASVGMGAFFGSLTMSKLTDKWPKTSALWRSMLTIGAFGGLLRIFDYGSGLANAIMFAGGGVIIGMALATTSILVITQRMNIIDKAQMGQATAAFSIITWGGVPAGALLGAPALTFLGPEMSFVLAAFTLLLCPLLALLPPLGRQARM